MPYSSVNLRQDFRHLSDIIGVYPNRDHTCVGMAVSKGRRCQARTNAPNRAHAIRLLDEGTRLLQLGQRNIDNILEALAPLLLCTRYHQNQAATVARQWSQQVEIDQRRSQDTTTSSVTFPVARNSSQQPRDREAITRRSRESSTLSSFTTNTQSSLSSDTGLDDLKDTFEALLRLLEGASQRASGSINTSSVASARTGESTRRSLSSAEPIVTRNERTSNATPQISGHSSERRRASSGTTTSSRQVRGNERGVSPPTRSSAVASTRNATDIPTTFQQTGPAQSPSIGETSNRQPQRRARTERREVVRKPIEGECYICFMSLRDSEEATAAQGEEEERQFQADNTATTEARPNGPEEVVWCKNQCGYNFHKNCVEAWTNSCERNHNAVTCPMCRTQWVRQ